MVGRWLVWLGTVAVVGLVLVVAGDSGVGAQDNNPATGVPTIGGTVRVWETLTVDTSDIADADGMTNADLQYQWIAKDGTDMFLLGWWSEPTFIVPAWVEGMTLYVNVQFHDDLGHHEARPSAETTMVAGSLTKTVPLPPTSLEVSPAASGELEVSWWSGTYHDGGSVITASTVEWKEATDSWDTASDVSEHEVTGDEVRYAGDYTITGLADGVAVSVRVIATNSVGDSPPSVEVTGTPGTQFSISGLTSREVGEDSSSRSVQQGLLANPDGTLVIHDLAERYEAHNAAPGATIDWSLSGADSDDFLLSEGTAWAWLYFASLPDYDMPADTGGDNSYEVTIEATDGTNTATLAVTVEVTDVNEEPDLSGPAAVDHPEGTTGVVAEFTADDPEGATIDWTLSGVGSDLFNLTSGVLTFRATPDYEELITDRGTNVFVLVVEATDGTYTPRRVVVVTVTDVDEEGAVSLTPSQPRVGNTVVAALDDPDGGVTNIAWEWARSQNRVNWSPIGTATTSSYTTVDTDVGYYLRGTVTYDDANGVGKDAEAVTTRAVRTNTPPPPPPPPPPTPRGGGGGGGGGAGGGGVVSGPDAGAPAFDEGSQASRTVAENTAAGVGIGEPVAATDPDDDPLTYTLIGSARDTFTIDPKSGQLRTEAPLDYETKHTYSVSVGVRDNKDPDGKPDRRRDDSIRVTINVTNVDEVGFITLSAPTPRVGAPLEAAVTDPDGGITAIVWAWEKSTDRTTWTPIRGATGSSYAPTGADETHYLRVVATYTDGHGPDKNAIVVADHAVATGRTTGYTDVVPEGVHTAAVEALAADGVFVDTECGAGLFCPNEPIQRWVVAVWLIRALGHDPTTVGTSRFDDIGQGRWWIRYAEELADREITVGCGTNPPQYCPDGSVTRAQMASFLVRAFNLPPAPTPAGFTDTEGNTHEDNIDALAAAGITVGCDTDPLRYCPNQTVTRAQMATFLNRALNRSPPAT